MLPVNQGAIMFWTLLFLFSFSVYGVEKPKNNDDLWTLLNSYRPRINPAIEVPQYPQYYYWETATEVSQGVDERSKVPIYIYESLSQRLYLVGWVPLGKELKLKKFQEFEGRIYYEVDSSLVDFKYKPANAVFWLEGRYVRRVDEKSFRPPANFSFKHGMKIKTRKD